ncbi:DNA-processing protein DprA [Demequina sp.]|uniref:DNA-processing protein DprA n=1 Tax=Demequina sp. TaxID=2050685 RepID=UPI003D130CEA
MTGRSAAVDVALSGDDRQALIAWSVLAEGYDEAAAWLVDELGASAALAWLIDAAKDPVAATVRLAPLAPPKTIDKAVAAAERWLRRLGEVDPAGEMARAHAVGARLVTRLDAEWPTVLDDLESRAPYALWVRGDGDLCLLMDRAVAVVGSRAATAYGEHVAADIAGGLSDAGWCVVSGGAYGIDAAAHRAALTGPTPSVAVMAGGVDRLYPAGHHDLLTQVMDGGVVVSEVPIGYAPHRSRFLARNRLIAAAAATCVVEAATRSGALNTVNHALALARPVAAVPGPVTSVASGGCHRLIRDGLAVLVTQAREVLELAGPIGPDADEGSGDGFGSAAERAAFDAIARRGSRVEDVARGAGLAIAETFAALMGLELAGKARATDGVWRRRETTQN